MITSPQKAFLGLFPATTCEPEPPVKFGGAFLAPATSSYSKRSRNSLDDTSETDIFIKDECRQWHSVWHVFLTLFLGALAFRFFHNSPTHFVVIMN
jgi:hypothetical protein